jgi:hypothetical protein
MHISTSGVTASATYSQRVINDYNARIVFVQGRTLIFRTWWLWWGKERGRWAPPPRHSFPTHRPPVAVAGGRWRSTPTINSGATCWGGIERGSRIGFDYSRPLVSARRNLPSASNQPAVINGSSARRCKPGKSWARSPEARSTGSISIAWG